jgi:hypothetical protein
MENLWKTRRWSVVFGVLMVALALTLTASPVASAHAERHTYHHKHHHHHKISFSGQAIVVEVTTRQGTTIIVGTNRLPPSGGTRSVSLARLNVNVSGVEITAFALRGLTVGEGDVSRSVASLEHLVINDGMGNIVTADVVEARAEAKCVSGKARVASHFRVTNLTVNGKAKEVTGAPNQVIVVSSVGSGESLLINSVFTSAGSITQTALQFIQTDLQGISFASVTADVSNCPARHRK